MKFKVRVDRVEKPNIEGCVWLLVREMITDTSIVSAWITPVARNPPNNYI